jgi:DNA-binding GntR family transcriptional regulator
VADEDRPEPLVKYITKQVQTDIAQRKLPPGSRLSPSSLASVYGVSHIPIREALSSLAATGYIVHRPSRGFFTRELSTAELQDIYRWRRVLEAEAYTVAVPSISADDLRKMQEVSDAMKPLTGPEDRLRYLELNREFHFVAFERAGSPILLQLLNYLWDISAPYVALDLINSVKAHRDHVRQMKLYKSRDLAGILEAMDSHRGYRLEKVASSDAVKA